MSDESNCSTSHTPESSSQKRGRSKVTLNSVLMVVVAIWRSYKLISRLIEFFRELTD